MCARYQIFQVENHKVTSRAEESRHQAWKKKGIGLTTKLVRYHKRGGGRPTAVRWLAVWTEWEGLKRRVYISRMDHKNEYLGFLCETSIVSCCHDVMLTSRSGDNSARPLMVQFGTRGSSELITGVCFHWWAGQPDRTGYVRHVTSWKYDTV